MDAIQWMFAILPVAILLWILIGTLKIRARTAQEPGESATDSGESSHGSPHVPSEIPRDR